jgi:PAS domain-containing protein
MSEVTFAIGEVAAMIGLSPHTIRAWERRHLFARPIRTASGQRRFTSEDVELLRQIKYERHVHGLSMRVATMTAQGLLVPDAPETSRASAAPPAAHGHQDPVRMVADLVSDVVIVVDVSGRIRHANTAFVRFSDMLLGQLQGMPFADFVDPFDRAKAVQVYHEPLRTRRGWELGLRTSRRRALFSFDCWPVPAVDGPALVLVGRRPDAEPAAQGSPAASEANDPSEPAAERAPAGVRALLEGVADPVRTLELLRPWLDATPLGVVLTGTDPDLTPVAANAAFRRLVPPALLPVEGRPWRELAPDGGSGRIAAAAGEVVGSGQCRAVPGLRTACDHQSAGPPTIWDVELHPVSDVGGSVTHLVLCVRDVTTEIATVRRLEPLATTASELRTAPDARQVLAAAARHARSLLRNAGLLVATVRGRDPAGISVVAADGVWAQSDKRELRMALVRDVIRTGASVEIERSGADEAVETFRLVPLRGTAVAMDETAVQGALAFCRLGASPFSAADRLLIDEFAGRVGIALGRVEMLRPARRQDALPAEGG